MALSARHMADNASFQAFVNAFLKEIEAGVWHDTDSWHRRTGLVFNRSETHVIELKLSALKTTLAIGVQFRSLVGRHRLTRVYQQQLNGWDWKPLDNLSSILLLIDTIYANEPDSSQRLELIARVIESHQVMADYLAYYQTQYQRTDNTFIDSEQSLIFGHWLHPTPKSRQGIHAWQHRFYTPEQQSQFQLHFFAADRQWVEQDSLLDASAESMMEQIARQDSRYSDLKPDLGKHVCLLAIHPLQAQWLVHQPYVQALIENNKLTDLGLLGPAFTPTSSVRTLYCESLDYMIKLSLPVKITNSLRVNMYHELAAGVYITKLIHACGFSKRYPKFRIIDDPAYITLALPDRKESGFEIIIRENPFSHTTTQEERCVHSIASLVQEPLEADSESELANIIKQLARLEEVSLKAVSKKWFDAYWHCAIEPAIYLYDQEGVALEAHQQNSLLNVSQGYPSIYYYRDNQGYYLSSIRRDALISKIPELGKIAEIFYDDDMICHRFSYYLIINQLFSIINRFALDQLIDETTLLIITHEKLNRLLPNLNMQGRQLVNFILKKKRLPCKGNLLTRVYDVDELQAENELAVYTYINNPIARLHQATHNPRTSGPVTQDISRHNALLTPE